MAGCQQNNSKKICNCTFKEWSSPYDDKEFLILVYRMVNEGDSSLDQELKFFNAELHHARSRCTLRYF